MGLTSARERRLWTTVLTLQVAIYASLAFVRGPTTWLRERNLLRLVVGLLFLVALIWILKKLRATRPRWPEVALLLAFGAALAVFGLQLGQVEERVHLLEYGSVGGLIYAAVSERRRNLEASGRPPDALSRFPAAFAIVLTGLLGWGDEGIQALLPNRVYELRDAGINLLSGLLVIAALAGRNWIRSRTMSEPPA